MSEQPLPEFYFISQEQLLKDRRERIATTCLAGMLGDSSTEWPKGTKLEDIQKELASIAVGYADALIKELDGGGK